MVGITNIQKFPNYGRAGQGYAWFFYIDKEVQAPETRRLHESSYDKSSSIQVLRSNKSGLGVQRRHTPPYAEHDSFISVDSLQSLRF